MGCGCKNKGNQNPAPATEAATQQAAQANAVTQESVKSSITSRYTFSVVSQ